MGPTPLGVGDPAAVDAASAAALPVQPAFFYGWVVLGVATLAAFFSGPGQTFGMSAFIESYVEAFQWTRSEVSFLYLVGTCGSASLQTSLGGAIDQYGPRRSVVLFAGMLSLACYINATVVSDKLTCAVGFFLVRLFGQGGMSLVPKTLVPRWFVRRRGIAMGLLSVGWMASQAVLPTVNDAIIDRAGFRACWKFWALAVLTFVPVAALLLVDTPADAGLEPDGDPPRHLHDNCGGVGDAVKPSPSKLKADGRFELPEGDQSAAQAVKSPQFWALSLCNVEGALVHTAVTFHAFSIVGHDGAPGFLAARSLVGLPTNLLAGWFVDTVGSRAVLTAGFALQTAGILMLTHVAPTDAGAVVPAAGGLLGASAALVSIALSTILPSSFGITHLGSINGMFASVGVFGSAIGPWVFGVMMDKLGAWRWSLWASAAAGLACVAVAGSVRERPPTAAV